MRTLPMLLLFLTALLVGCAADEVEKSRAPEALLREAAALIADRDFDEAKVLLTEVRERHPFSAQAVEAELLAADIEYDSENFEAAEAAYRAFEAQHPFHPRLDHALFRRAECQARRMDGDDRDQAPARAAADTFRRLLEARPDSPYVPQARQRLAEVRETLAAHELYVARYYFRREQYGAALDRLAYLARTYPEAAAASEAKALAAEIEAERAAQTPAASPETAPAQK